MFVEIQRADTKATALCGVTGGLLAIVAGAVLTAPTGSSRVLGWVLALVGVLLGAALVSALRALRPVFPKEDGLMWQDESASGESGGTEPPGRTPGQVVSAEEFGPRATRSVVLTRLARRKFRAVKASADLTVAAIGVAGMGLLLAFVMS
ncbi:hypothetical protein [Streptomyces sp. NPDC059564]|uniref:hypothetical protein n=1 Tax=Streptomyces sp. NPDC059564 TaxID=3346865 RepID=UPI0036B19999